MFDKQQIRQHMDVVDARGEQIGKVDGLERDDRIKLTRSDSKDEHHHYIPASDVDRVDGDRLVLKESARIPQGAA